MHSSAAPATATDVQLTEPLALDLSDLRQAFTEVVLRYIATKLQLSLETDPELRLLIDTNDGSVEVLATAITGVVRSPEMVVAFCFKHQKYLLYPDASPPLLLWERYPSQGYIGGGPLYRRYRLG